MDGSIARPRAASSLDKLFSRTRGIARQFLLASGLLAASTVALQHTDQLPAGPNLVETGDTTNENTAAITPQPVIAAVTLPDGITIDPAIAQTNIEAAHASLALPQTRVEPNPFLTPIIVGDLNTNFFIQTALPFMQLPEEALPRLGENFIVSPVGLEADPLLSPHPIRGRINIPGIGRVDKLQFGLQRSAAVMAARGLTADSVIAYHQGQPITVTNALADKDIWQLPPARHFDQWVACLEEQGFTRRNESLSGATNLVRALGRAESGAYRCAVSYARTPAMGYFQFIETTAAGYNLTNPFNMPQAVRAANALMADNLRATGNDVCRALALYNSGRDPGRNCTSAYSAGSETALHYANTMRHLGGAAVSAIEEATRPQAEEQPARRRTLFDMFFAPN